VFRIGQPLTAAETDATLHTIRTQRNGHNAGEE
jgi:hypothetical protein